MFSRIKAVKNHVIVTLDQVKTVQAEQLLTDANTTLQQNNALQNILESLESKNKTLTNLINENQRAVVDPLNEKHQALIDLFNENRQGLSSQILAALLDQKNDLANLITPLYSRLNELDANIAQLGCKIDRVIPHRDFIRASEENRDYFGTNPEVCLLMHLRTFLQSDVVIDIGANVGDVSEQLLNQGYRVFAFEPLPQAYEQLNKNLASHENFKSFALAIGETDEIQNFYTVKIADEFRHLYGADASVYSTLYMHPLPNHMSYDEPIKVKVRSLTSLHSEGELPSRAAIVKIDTEGNDLNVIKGMGEADYDLVMAEFWDASHYFSKGTSGLLTPLVMEMRKRGFGWHILVYRVLEGNESSMPRFCTNFAQSPENSWGNVLFFRDYKLFIEAYHWCKCALQEIQMFHS